MVRDTHAAIVGCGLFIFFSAPVFAEPFHWKYRDGDPYPTPRAACEPLAARFVTSGDKTIAGTIKEIKFWRDDVADCIVSPPAGYEYAGEGTYRILRAGDGCIEPDTYNSATGGCEPPPPECKAGDPGIFKGSEGSVIESGGRKYVGSQPPSDVCYNQCSFTVSDRASSCFLLSGSTTTGFCNYLGSGTGSNCKAPDAALGQTGDPLNPPETPDVPPSDPNDPGCPPGYGWSGTTCVKNPTDDGGNGPGDGDGDGDGDSGGGSGGGDGNGGDGGDGGDGGSGNGGDGDGNGSGGDGDGNGSGDGNGDGDGEGQCDPAKDPKKCGQSSVGGEACNVDLKCEGDAIQCAILRKNKEQVCQWTYDANVKKQIADEMAGEAYQLKESSIPVSGLFTEALNKGRWLPQSCPSPQTVSVMGRTYSISWEPLCRFATAMGPIVVALASIFFAVFIGRGLKGS